MPHSCLFEVQKLFWCELLFLAACQREQLSRWGFGLKAGMYEP